MRLSSKFNYVKHEKKGIVYVHGENKKYMVVNSDAFQLLESFESKIGIYESFYDEAIECGLLDNSLESPKVRTVGTKYHLKRVQWELTLACNLSCVHCYCSASPAAPRGMSTEKARSVIDQLSEMGVLYLDFTGGEPLVRKDIFELISYAREKGMIVSLFTNATLVTEAIAIKLAELQIDSIQTSLDGVSAEVHDSIRQKKGAFAQALRGVSYLKKTGS